MKNTTQNTKIPFIVKNIIKRYNLIKITSVFTSDSEEITIERLKYLINNNMIELLNAYINDNNEVVLTDNYTNIKNNRQHIKELLSGEINSPDVLTDTQKKLSVVFETTPLEIDIGQSSRYCNDMIISKPITVSENNYIITAILEKGLTNPKTTITIETNDHRHRGSIPIYETTSEQLNKLIKLLDHISDDIELENYLSQKQK